MSAPARDAGGVVSKVAEVAHRSLLVPEDVEPEHVVSTSGGLGSWHAGRRVRDRHGTDRLTLLHLDAGMEDPDTYRFLIEGSADVLGVPLQEVADLASRARELPPVEREDLKPRRLAALGALAADAQGRIPGLVWVHQGKDVWDVYEERNFLGNNRVDVCSIVLKREAAERWIRSRFFPEEVVLYLGFDATERARQERAKARWLPYRVENPLVEEPPEGDPKEAAKALCRDAGMEVPLLYRLGFAHGNCSAFCCRAGKSHFVHLLRTMPERYRYFEEREERLRARIGDYTILREQRDGVRLRISLRQLRERVERVEAADRAEAAVDATWEVNA